MYNSPPPLQKYSIYSYLKFSKSEIMFQINDNIVLFVEYNFWKDVL